MRWLGVSQKSPTISTSRNPQEHTMASKKAPSKPAKKPAAKPFPMKKSGKKGAC